MRVPTIAWWPGRVPAGTSSDAICGMMDILPTLVGLAGGSLPTDRKLDGGDLWPVISGRPDAPAPHEVFHYFRGLQLEAIRRGPWKLRLAKTELYNLADDIGETTNVAETHPEVVQQLEALAAEMDRDLGREGQGPGVRPLGRVADPQPIIAPDGTVRPELRGAAVSDGTGRKLAQSRLAAERAGGGPREDGAGLFRGQPEIDGGIAGLRSAASAGHR